MSEYAIIFQILGVLLALFFIFLTVMNFKSWRWLHALTTFAVFCAVGTFMVYAALVMKTRLAWEESAFKFKEAYDKQNKNVEKVVNGDPTDQASVETSLAHYRNELARAIVDRGRIWRHCTPAGNADGTVTLTMNLGAAPAPVDPAAPVPAAPAAPAAPVVAKEHKLQAQDIVFAFKEFAMPDGMSIPAYYVGEFQVTAVTPTTVTLKMVSTFLRPGVQQDEVNAPWMLYEVLPPDSHEAFADPTDLKTTLPDLPKAMSLDYLTKTVGIPASVAQSYARDNGDGNPSDENDNKWWKVKFLKAHEIVVDASQTVPPVDDVPYNGQGQAQLPRLLRTKDVKTADPVKFAANDVAIFDNKTADDLANAKIVEKQKLIYRRRLHDYEKAFQVMSRRLYVLRGKTATVIRDTATVVAARDKANEQIKLQEAETLLLQADLAKVKYERDEMKKYADAVAARVLEKRTEMSRLYKSNMALHAKIQERIGALTEEVEKKQREATLPALATEKKD